MKRLDLVKIFFRSLLIQSSLNFRRMQNLGFVYALMPMARRKNGAIQGPSDLMQRHLVFFNTHPYMSASIIGSVVRLEEDPALDQDGDVVVRLKKTMMGPYAAIGDTFFWGALRPFAAIIAVTAVLQGALWAPIVFLAIYEPFHIWIRWKGFLEGYRLGPQGFQFVQALNLTAMAPKIRWLSVVCLAIMTAWWLESQRIVPIEGFHGYYGIMACALVLSFVLMFSMAIRQRVSPLLLIYAMTFISFLVSM
ncbi:MAG: mannose PTS system EIID component [Syntrophus sp. SKADARSKE-3]|nr:mannose PTS system EIID component [Syntrophus sp. SKADARSKE-3]